MLGVSVFDSARAAPPGSNARLVLPHSQLQQLQRCWNMWVKFAAVFFVTPGMSIILTCVCVCYSLDMSLSCNIRFCLFGLIGPLNMWYLSWTCIPKTQIHTVELDLEHKYNKWFPNCTTSWTPSLKVRIHGLWCDTISVACS